MVELLDLNDSPIFLKFQNGDIVIAQPRLSEKEKEQFEFPFVVDYLQHLHNLRRINFRKLHDPFAPGTILEVPKDADYKTVVHQLANTIGCSYVLPLFLAVLD